MKNLIGDNNYGVSRESVLDKFVTNSTKRYVTRFSTSGFLWMSPGHLSIPQYSNYRASNHKIFPRRRWYRSEITKKPKNYKRCQRHRRKTIYRCQRHRWIEADFWEGKKLWSKIFLAVPLRCFWGEARRDGIKKFWLIPVITVLGPHSQKAEPLHEKSIDFRYSTSLSNSSIYNTSTHFTVLNIIFYKLTNCFNRVLQKKNCLEKNCLSVFFCSSMGATVHKLGRKY